MSSFTKLASRALGKNGPMVPRLGLGLMGQTTGIYGTAPPVEAQLAMLDKAYEMGETFWDTADMYGDSESVLGKWFAANPEKRPNVFLATKFGNLFSKTGGCNTTPEYCHEAIDKSLERLGLPYVDLYYIHRLDKVTPIEKTIQAMVELKKAGKIKHIGLSECGADTLRRAHAVHPVACVQMEYSAFVLDIESPKYGVLEAARELGIAIVAYSPLGKGLLTGTLRTPEEMSKPGDQRSKVPRLSGENLEINLALVDKITELAKAKGVTTAQLALAWLLAQGDDFFAIPGTTKAERLAENLGALDVSLSADEEKEVRNLADKVAGLRMPEYAYVTLHADTPPLAE